MVAANRLTGRDPLNCKTTVRDISHTLHPVPDSRGAGTREIKVFGRLTLRIRMTGNNDQPPRLGFDTNQCTDQ
ncbi:hypothetical protein D3C80_1594670 [compost metagenome]